MARQNVYIGRTFCLQPQACIMIVATISLFEGICEMVAGTLTCQKVQCILEGDTHIIWDYHYYKHCYAHIPHGCFGREYEWFSICAIFQGLLNILCSVLVLIGLPNMMPNMMLPYLILMSFAAIAYLAEGLTILLTNEPLFGYGIWFIIWGVVLCYFIYVVYSYREMMVLQITNRQRMASVFSPAMQMTGQAAPPTLVANPGQAAAAGVYHSPGARVWDATGNNCAAAAPPASYHAPGAHRSPGRYPAPGSYSAAGAGGRSGSYPAPPAYSTSGPYQYPSASYPVHNANNNENASRKLRPVY